MNIEPELAGDLRRAGALIRHHVGGDYEGVNAVLAEVRETRRSGEFVTAVFDVLMSAVAELLTDPGICAMHDMIETLIDADLSTFAPEMHRAARLTDAVLRGDNDHANAILHETHEDVAPLIVAVLDLFGTILPQLHTHVGLKMLDTGITTCAAQEAV